MNRCLLLFSALVLAASGAAAVEGGLVERTCQVVDLRDTKGEIRFALDGTALLASASGEAKLDVELKRTEAPLRINAKGLVSTQRFGQEYLTYVAWIVDASGATKPLGEMRNVGGEATLVAKVPRGAFGIIVTAEPHFAVTRPSNSVVLNGRPTVKTAKRLTSTEVTCRLLPRGHYAMGRTQESMQLLFASQATTPSELLQARNAIDIARLSGAEQFARDRLDEATQQLIQANSLLLDNGQRKQAAATAAKSVTSAEMARQIAVDRKRDEALRLGDLEQARRQADEASALLEQARRQSALEAEKRAELEQRLQEEKDRGAEAERRREQALLERIEMRRPDPQPATPPASTELERFELVTERARIEQEREAARRENELLRQELREEREQLIRESRRELESGLELERAKLQIALADERAELKVERARLEAERKLLEARQAEPAPVATAAPAPGGVDASAAEAAAPAGPDAADSKELAWAQAEWDLLSKQISAERDALTVEREELRALSDELESRLAEEPRPASSSVAQPAKEKDDQAQEPDRTTAAEEPAKQKRRWWFGKKKATPASTAAAGADREASSASPSTAELEEEWQRLQSDRESLAAERTELADERQKLEKRQAEQEPAKRRWWFGGKKDRNEPVAVEDPVAAAEISRLESERSQMEAEMQAERRRMDSELQIERERLSAERARLEADMKLREAARYRDLPAAPPTREQPDPRVALLNQRVERLERDLAQAEEADSGAETEQRQADLLDELERLREQVQALEAAQSAKPASEAKPAAPAVVPVKPAPLVASLDDEERLATLLNAERSPRGLLVRLPDLSFPTGGHELRPEAREQLARVAGVLLGQSGVWVEIEGHTDSTGDSAANQRLSELRAAAVLSYLAQLGVSGSAMTAKGFGDLRPVAPNETAAGRRQNRRVELLVKTATPQTAAVPGRPS